MITAKEAFEKAFVIIDKHAKIECDRIGKKIEQLVENGYTNTECYVSSIIYKRVIKLLRKLGYVASYREDMFDGKICLSID
jgi:hypothetical protein